MPRFELEDDDDQFDNAEIDEFDDDVRREPAQRWPAPVSGKAITSLVFSVMFCIPMIPSLLALIFGAASLGEIGRGRRSGRGYALTGLVFGMIGVGGWLLLGALSYLVWQMMTLETDKAKSVANQFVRELSMGKVDKAIALAVPGVEKGPLEASSKAMAEWGKFERLDVDARPVVERNNPFGKPGMFRWELEGSSNFAKNTPEIVIRLTTDGTEYRVEKFAIEGKWAIGGARWGDAK